MRFSRSLFALPNQTHCRMQGASHGRDRFIARLAAATANAEKFQKLVDCTKITAPFDGIITRRYPDPGALIQAGTSSGTESRSRLRVSGNYRLRLDFPVSVDYVKDIQIEESAVKLGLETPDKYEVISGLQKGDLVVIGNGTAFQTGEKVEPTSAGGNSFFPEFEGFPQLLHAGVNVTGL